MTHQKASKRVIPESVDDSFFDYVWLGPTVEEGSLLSSDAERPVVDQLNTEKLKLCLLSHNYLLKAAIYIHSGRGSGEAAPTRKIRILTNRDGDTQSVYPERN